MMFKTIENWALHAYADGELSDAEKADVDRLLQQDPEARRVLDGIRRQKSALHKAYGPVGAETIPPGILAAAHGKFARRPGLGQWRNMAAGIAISLMVGAGASWYALRGSDQAGDVLASRAANLYKVFATEQNHPVEMAGADREQLEHWLAKRIGVSFTVPDLTPQGYTLVGGRMLAEDDRPAGLLLYENANKERLAVYLAANPAANESGMTVKKVAGLTTCYWVEKDLVYALAGEQKKADMLVLAAAAHDGFDKEG
jgi:anti-sigma factor RsiW